MSFTLLNISCIEFPDDLSLNSNIVQISGNSGAVSLKAMLDNDCSEGDEQAFCFLAGGTNSNTLVTGFWMVTVKGDCIRSILYYTFS